MSLTLTGQLHQRTRDLHERLNATAFAAALASGGLELQGFVSYLRSLAVIHAALETAASPGAEALWHASMGRLPHLLEDLEQLRHATTADCEDALDAALSLAVQIRCRRSGKLARSWLGNLYALESSKRDAAPRPGSRTWVETCAKLDGLELAAEEREAVLDTACETYAALIRIYESLLPLRQESVRPLASSFNPEAGMHPVTSDPREIEAALAAGRASWDEFPYLKSRYGERGRRFTTSDSVWLVTLTRAPRAAAVSQVLWLGRVLAARGMPRLILEAHLRTLCFELVRSVPENETSYRVLEEAAEVLSKKRRAWLGDDAMAAMAVEFDALAGVGGGASVDAGRLIAGAVCDERDGVPNAVESLTAWLGAPAQFSGAFNAAVVATLAKARATASRA